MKGWNARRWPWIVAGLFVVLALVIVVGSVGSRGGDGSRPRASAEEEAAAPEVLAPLAQDGVEAPRVAVAERGAAGAAEAREAGGADGPTSTALVVRSTLGLALPRAFFVREDGVERKIALSADGACVVPRAPPFRVRASGHREVEVSEPGEVVLEPVLGIVLRAPRLRERALGARLLWEPIERYPEHEDWVLCGHPSDDAFAVAIDPRGRSVGDRSFGFVPIDLTTSDLLKIDVEVERHVEGTYEHDLVLGEHAPASLALAPGRCPTGCEAPVERALWTLERPGAESPTTTAHPWGSLVVQGGWGMPRPAGPEERVVPGVEYGLGARCPACGAYGRRFIVPVAGENAVELPLEHRGTVLLARVDCMRFNHVRLQWEGAWAPGRRLEGLEAWGWFGEDLLEPDREGVVRLVLPHAVPVRRDCAWPMPPAARVTASDYGAEPVELWPELPPGATVDLGLLALGERRPDLLLASGHGALVPRYAGFRHGAEAVLLDVERHVARPDGDLEVFLYPRAPFDPASPPAQVLLCDDAERVLGLELLEGRYVATPRVRRTLVVESGPSDLPGAPAELIAGVRWAGLEVAFNLRLPVPEPGRPVEWTLEWPSDAESLWWKVAREDPLNHVPLFAGIERIALR